MVTTDLARDVRRGRGRPRRGRGEPARSRDLLRLQARQAGVHHGRDRGLPLRARRAHRGPRGAAPRAVRRAPRGGRRRGRLRAGRLRRPAAASPGRPGQGLRPPPRRRTGATSASRTTTSTPTSSCSTEDAGLFDSAWPIRTQQPQREPARVLEGPRSARACSAPGASSAGVVTRSVLGPGRRGRGGSRGRRERRLQRHRGQERRDRDPRHRRQRLRARRRGPGRRRRRWPSTTRTRSRSSVARAGSARPCRRDRGSPRDDRLAVQVGARVRGSCPTFAVTSRRLELVGPVDGRPDRTVAPSRAAYEAASERECSPSLARIRLTWCATVLRLRNSRAAISGLLSPVATSVRTSRSRWVRRPGSLGPGPGATPRLLSIAPASAACAVCTKLLKASQRVRRAGDGGLLVRVPGRGSEVQPGPGCLEGEAVMSECVERVGKQAPAQFVVAMGCRQSTSRSLQHGGSSRVGGDVPNPCARQTESGWPHRGRPLQGRPPPARLARALRRGHGDREC